MIMKHNAMILLGVAACFASTLTIGSETKPPVIDHSPVKVALRGQNIIVRATITNDSGSIKEATLFVAVSRDAAPFRVAMHDTGAGVYTGTISADLLGNLDRFQYYIDAVDAQAQTTETPWYTVEVKSAEAGKNAPADGGAPESESKQSSWVKPALIVGGVLAVGGAALALSHGGGSSSPAAPVNTATNSAGTYAGSQTTCFQPSGGSSTCASGAITITIDTASTVTSDTLYTGQHLTGQLSGNNFVLVAAVQTGGQTGQVQFLGTVVDTRIVGSITGSAKTGTGDGTYSGSFSAVRQ